MYKVLHIHNLLTYFRGIIFCATGYECEEFNNPSDFFLDVINGDSSIVNGPEGMFRTGRILW
jgi:hypothetical protein